MPPTPPSPPTFLFFDRSGPTREIWYYELPLPEGRKNYTKTKPLQYEEFAPCLQWWANREETEQAWRIPVDEILQYDTDGQLQTCNLDRKNPHRPDSLEHLPPEQLIDDILEKENRILELMQEIKEELKTP